VISSRLLVIALIVGLPSALEGQIVLERTSCFGTCPAYRLTVRSDGGVIFIGRNSFAVDSGSKKIESRVVDSLTNQLIRSGFLALADSYHREGAGCVVWGTDQPTIVLKVRKDSVQKTVSYDLGCFGDSLPKDRDAAFRILDNPPASRTLIQELAAAVDSAVGVAQWLRLPRSRH